MTEASEGAALLDGRYALGATLAVGGSAILTRALDTALDRPVAIKRPRVRDTEVEARLRHEGAILGRCGHPGIVACTARGDDEDGAPYLVLQLIDGPNLVQRLDTGGLTFDVALAWAVEVCRAVAHLDSRGIVHGDLKPQHIVIDTDGHAVLVDFDRAHDASDVGARATGTEPYVAPEVLRGGATTIASDHYALGAVLRWLLERVEAGDDMLAIVTLLLGDEPARRPSAATVAEALARRYAPPAAIGRRVREDA